jgi:hypothetical protein
LILNLITASNPEYPFVKYNPSITKNSPPISNFDKPNKKDKKILYRLSFPADYNDKNTGVSKVSDSFNAARDENLIRKTKDYENKGYKVVSTAGNGHIDLIKNRKQK